MSRFNFVFALIILSSISMFSQTQVDSLRITPNGVNGFVVIEIDQTQEELYKKALTWVKHTYTDEDAVIISASEGEFIRFHGIHISGMTYAQGNTIFGVNVEIMGELKFKPGKIRYDIIDLKLYNDAGLFFLKGGALDPCIYNRKGEPRKRALGSEDSLNITLNSNIISLKNYIITGNLDGDW